MCFPHRSPHHAQSQDVTRRPNLPRPRLFVDGPQDSHVILEETNAREKIEEAQVVSPTALEPPSFKKKNGTGRLQRRQLQFLVLPSPSIAEGQTRPNLPSCPALRSAAGSSNGGGLSAQCSCWCRNANAIQKGGSLFGDKPICLPPQAVDFPPLVTQYLSHSPKGAVITLVPCKHGNWAVEA